MLRITRVLLASVLFYSSLAHAADPAPESGAASKSKASDNGGYGAPELKVTQLAGSMGVLFGSQGGWIHRNHFVLGGAGCGLVNDVSLQRGGEKQLSLGYGGVRPGFILGERDDLIHVNGGVILGAAGVGVGDESVITYVIEPDVGADVQALSWMRIGISGGYRFMFPASEGNLTFAQLSGLAVGMNVKLGSF